METYNEYGLKRIERNTRRRNAAFEKMPNHRKRVLIAKDVLKALATKKLVAKSGSYIKIGYDNCALSRMLEENPDESFQETLKNIPQCTVCAKGAIFTCTVSRRNQVKNSSVPHNNVAKWQGIMLSPLLGNIFSPDQLRLIETEFEGENYDRPDGGYISPVMEGMNGLTGEDRMIRIMRNIIRNNGDFIPSKD